MPGYTSRKKRTGEFVKREFVNVGFLGVGSLSTKQHVPNAFRNPILRVHTLCDLSSSRLAFYKERYNPTRVTEDYRQMLADPEVDLVVIAMQPSLHVKFSIECVQAGKHVYVEKPLADTTEEAMKLARAAKAAGRNVSVGFNRRFAPSYRDLFGAVAGDKGPLLINYRMVDDARDRSSWYGGRIRLIDEACHVFDVFNWLAQSEPVGVYASEFGRKEDHQVTVEYANGVTAGFFMSSFGAFGWPKERIEVVGDNKVVGVEDFIELQAAGVPGLIQRNYPGREYDGFTHGYAQGYDEVGLPMYRYMRRLMERRLLASGLIDKVKDRDKWEALAEMAPEDIHIPVNYSCDKGWYSSLDEAGRAILENRAPGIANAQDAAKTIEMGMAAIESTKTKAQVRLNQSAWKV